MPDVIFSEGGIAQVSKNDLDLVAEINCSSTMYRECFYSSDPDLLELLFRVPKDKVNHRFDIDTLIIARRSLGLEGLRIDKGMPLAHLGSVTIKLSRNQKGLIVFDKSNAPDISYEFGSHVIKVRIPEKEYTNLARMKARQEVHHLLASQFAQIALLEASRFLKEGSGKSHLNWYEELLKRWKQLEPEKEYPEEEEGDHFRLVNQILKKPSLSFTRFLIEQKEREQYE